MDHPRGAECALAGGFHFYQRLEIFTRFNNENDPLPTSARACAIQESGELLLWIQWQANGEGRAFA